MGRKFQKIPFQINPIFLSKFTTILNTLPPYRIDTFCPLIFIPFHFIQRLLFNQKHCSKIIKTFNFWHSQMGKSWWMLKFYGFFFFQLSNSQTIRLIIKKIMKIILSTKIHTSFFRNNKLRRSTINSISVQFTIYQVFLAPFKPNEVWLNSHILYCWKMRPNESLGDFDENISQRLTESYQITF